MKNNLLTRMTKGVSYALIGSAILLPVSASPTTINANANNCEFYVDGVASIYLYNMAWSRRVLHSEVIALDPNIERLGQWIRYRDTASNEIHTTEVMASQSTSFVFLSPEKWSIDFEYAGTNFQNSGSPFSFEIVDFAFFAEKANDRGETLRTWISNEGHNFTFGNVFAPPTYTSSLGRGSIVWTDQNKSVFNQKRSCAFR
jgi:hypothetical protein